MDNTLSTRLSALLEPIAAWFRSLNVPEPIVHWGHPLMMAIVVLAMGSAVAWTGWRGRQTPDAAIAGEALSSHKKIAPLMFLFIALGYTGGVLSLVMQRQPILQSPHFFTGTIALLLLATNSLIALTGFGKNKATLRTVHAYVGSAALGLLLLHGIFGLKLGLSI